MKKLSLFAGVSAIALAATSLFPAISANAQTATYQTNDEIVLTRIVNGVSNPVTNTFTYTITAGDNPATVTGMPATETIVFNGVTPDTTGKATATKTIDISGLDFTAVGDYQWTIAETNSTDTTNYPLDSTTYNVNVSVRHALDSNNVPTGAYVAYLKEADATPTWTSDAERTDISIDATTTGNMADTSKCFDYTITVGEATGETYAVAYNPSAGTECSNPATISSGVPTTIRLKHGDNIVIGNDAGSQQLPLGATYSIAKVDTSDGYTNTLNPTTGTTAASGNAITTNNHKEADPVTGIVTNAWFYIILLAISVFGFFFFIIARRREDDEEQQ